MSMKNPFIIIFFIVLGSFMLFGLLNVHQTSYLNCDRTNNKCEIIRKTTLTKKVTVIYPSELLGSEIKQGHSSGDEGSAMYYYINLKTTRGDIFLNTISDKDSGNNRDDFIVNEINRFVANPAQLNLNIEIKNY